ncbi:MAG TPA: IS1 family transposase [Bryobacteraceae bacterium]|jgi:IS1 family transposase
MNKLDTAKRAQIVTGIIEGCSVRSISRMTGASKNTILKLVVELGDACSDYMNKHLVNLSCERIQCDEIWAFVAAKQANVTEKLLERNPHAGDCWTWVGMDADTKLVCSWWVGKRDFLTAKLFIEDLASRLANRVQLSTDGNRLYLGAIKTAFGNDIDYAIVHKLYGGSSKAFETENRYSPATCTGCDKKAKIGKPNMKLANTSFVERQNLTMRMGMRRFTRLTNAFSKKAENHIATLAIFYMHYNFVRIHQTLRVTPAMAANVTSRLWAIEDLVGLLP